MLEVVLARCDFLRRRGEAEPLRAAFQQGREALAAADAKFVDAALRLPAYQAHCELQLGGGPEAARAVWEDALKGEAGAGPLPAMRSPPTSPQHTSHRSFNEHHPAQPSACAGCSHHITFQNITLVSCLLIYNYYYYYQYFANLNMNVLVLQSIRDQLISIQFCTVKSCLI